MVVTLLKTVLLAILRCTLNRVFCKEPFATFPFVTCKYAAVTFLFVIESILFIDQHVANALSYSSLVSSKAMNIVSH